MRTRPYVRNAREMGPVRRIGLQMLRQGARQADVARELGVSRTTASNWAASNWAAATGCAAAGADSPAIARRLDLHALDALLAQGARRYGFPDEGWTMARIAVVVECRFGLACDSLALWRMLDAHLEGRHLPVIAAVLRRHCP